MSKKAKKAAVKVVKKEAKASHKAAANRDHPAVRAAGWLAEVADQPQLAAISVGTLVSGVALRRPELIRGGARMLAAHLTTIAVKSAIKHGVDRSRPEHELAGGGRTLRKGRSDDHALNSFPSGHTAGAVATARALSRDVDGAAGPATIAVGAVAAAQPVTGSHHVSDVLAGAVVGWLTEALVSAAFDRVEPVVERVLTRRRTAG